MITISLSERELTIVVQGLAELPYKISAPVIVALDAQITKRRQSVLAAQEAARASATTPEPAQETPPA